MAPEITSPFITKQDREEHTLHKLFLDELRKSVAVLKKLTLTLGDRRTLDCQGAAEFDFDAKAKWLSVYVPPSDLSFLACKSFCVDYLDVFKLIEKSATPSRKEGNDPFSAVSAKDLMFSGRLFIYDDNELTLSQHYSLNQTCNAHGAALQVRGPDYLSLRMLFKNGKP